MTRPGAYARGMFTLGTRFRQLGAHYGISYRLVRETPFYFASGKAGTLQEQLAQIARSQSLVATIVKDLYPECERLSRQDNDDHCDVTFQMPNEKSGHAYTVINKCYDLSKEAVEALADPENHNAFRLYYYCFPYPGCEFPPDQPQEKFFRESSGEVVIENAIEIEKWNQLADAYMGERYRNNEPIGGTVKLGPGGLVMFSDYHVMQVGKLVVRYALASTSHKHVFDGRALWIQIVNREARTVTFCAIGAGTHAIPAFDGANSVLAGPLFNNMLRNYVETLQQVPVGKAAGPAATLARVKLSNEVAEMKECLNFLACFSEAFAEVRRWVGYEVTRAPLEFKEQEPGERGTDELEMSEVQTREQESKEQDG